MITSNKHYFMPYARLTDTQKQQAKFQLLKYLKPKTVEMLLINPERIAFSIWADGYVSSYIQFGDIEKP